MSDHSAVLAFIAKDAASAPIGHITRAMGHFDHAASKSHASMSKFGSGIADVGKLAAGAALGGFALLASQVGFGIKALEDESKINAQTAAVLKSTGGAAGVTAAQVDALAESLKLSTGQSDETVRSTENLLLTFTKIQNQAGANNDIFTQSTKIALDMSQALGQDTKSSAIQLGKALNDPIKGMTALQRVGVSFTESQKAQVAAMVKAGDTLGAQKLILKELTTEFGGSAAAFGNSAAGMAAKLGNSWEDVQKTLAGAVLPVITNAFATVNAVLNDPRTQAALQQVSAAFASFASTLSAQLMPVVQGLVDTFLDKVAPALADLLPRVASLGTMISQTVAPAVGMIIGKLAGLIPVAAHVGSIVLDLAKRVWEGGLNKAIAAAARYIGSVIDVLRGLFEAITSNQDIMNILKGAADLIGQAFGTVADLIGQALDFLGQFGDSIRGNSTAMGLLSTIGKAIAGSFSLAGDAIRALIGFIAQVVAKAQEAIGIVAKIPGVSLIGTAATIVPTTAGNVLGGVGGFLGGLINGKASGGPVSAGGTYLVGERGPELLHMGGSGGSITPNGAGGATFNVNVNGAVFDPYGVAAQQIAASLLPGFRRELDRQGMSLG